MVCRIYKSLVKKNVVSGRCLHYIHALHERYGPIVRIAPNEIDIADPQVYKQIHRIGSGFLKDPWYQSFRPGDTNDIFSMIDPKEHSERRKLFASLWTNSALHESWEDMVTEKVRLAVFKIRPDALAGEADIFQWWTFMTTDVISYLAFGESQDMLKQESVGAFQGSSGIGANLRIENTIYSGCGGRDQSQWCAC